LPQQENVRVSSVEQGELLDRYVAAFEDYDIGALTDLFTAEATFQMPPFATWVQGPEYIERLVRVQCPARRPGDLVLVPTAANGQPAYGMYLRDSEGSHRAFGIHVLTLEQERIGHCSVFFDTTLFPFFDLALTLDRRVFRGGPGLVPGGVCRKNAARCPTSVNLPIRATRRDDITGQRYCSPRTRVVRLVSEKRAPSGSRRPFVLALGR